METSHALLLARLLEEDATKADAARDRLPPLVKAEVAAMLVRADEIESELCARAQVLEAELMEMLVRIHGLLDRTAWVVGCCSVGVKAEGDTTTNEDVALDPVVVAGPEEEEEEKGLSKDSKLLEGVVLLLPLRASSSV
jgi:hypothetical protein